MQISVEFERRAKAHNALVAERDALAAENERLRLAEKLMNAVAEEWRLMQNHQSGGCDIMYAVARWNAAKEGRDAK